MAIFELHKLRELGALPALADLPVGPWAWARPAIPSFDAGDGAALVGPHEPVWRVGLARDGAANRAALAGGEHSVARTHTMLDEVPHRFERALAGFARKDRSRTPAPAASPESDLLAALVAPGGPGAEPPDAGALAASTIAIGAAPEEPGQIERALDHIADLTRGRTRIETHVGGALVAQSVMTLSGDTELLAARRLSAEGARLHARSVIVAVRTRHAWARILTLVLRSCARLLVFGLPSGAATALPLAWRFVRGVLREARALKAAGAAT